MLVFNFDKAFKARGIDKPFTFLTNAGFSINFSTKLKNNRHTTLNLTYIEKLCILLNCTPNDFIQWIPNKGEENIENHPLKSLKRTEKIIELTKILNNIPLDKLNNIEEIIRKECDKKDE